MRLMLSYLKRYKGLVFLNFISVFGFALTELGIPTIISKMVDGGVTSGDREYLMKMGGLIAVISIVGILGTVVLGYCGARISTAVTCDIRNDLFEKVQSFSHREMNQLGVVHDLLDFAQKMVFGYEHIYVNNHCFAAGVFGVLFHEGASLGGFLLLYQKPSRLRRLLGEYSLTN